MDIVFDHIKSIVQKRDLTINTDSSDQHRKTTRPHSAAVGDVRPSHDVEHVQDKSKVHPYGRAVQVQAAGIYEDIPAMSNDTVVAF